MKRFLFLPIILLLISMGHAIAQDGLRTLSNARPVPLAMEEAFPYYVSETTPGVYQVSWDIAPDHYLYRHAFKFEFSPGDSSEVRELPFSIPDGIAKDDQFFGRVEAYFTHVVVDLQSMPGLSAGSILFIEYQGCAEWGFCYPPQRLRYPLL